MWSVYRTDMNNKWSDYNKVHPTDNEDDDDEEKNEASLDLSIGRAEKKNHSLKKVKELFDDLGHQIETLIDNSFLGVPDPSPWSPVTDKRAAALSTPVQTTVEFLNEICKSIEGIVGLPSRDKISEFHSETPFAALVFASQKVLLNVREGLSNAIREEEALAAVGGDLDMMVESEAGEAFVDLGAKKETSPRVREAKKAVASFAKNRILPFIDNLSVQISLRSGDTIIVTPDDCSVECSVASASTKEEFEECPSVVTECEGADDVDEEDEVVIFKEDVPKAVEMDAEESDDENEYVLAEEPPSDDEDFVDVRADYDIAYCP